MTGSSSHKKNESFANADKSHAKVILLLRKGTNSGFPDTWVQIIRKCICATMSLILPSTEVKGKIQINRVNIRQKTDETGTPVKRIRYIMITHCPF